MSDYEREIETFIREAFAENYEILRIEGQGSLTPDAREAALQQVLMYWRKMRAVAERVTETEVRLSLPGQRTAKGTPFTIEGVVDIVEDAGRTVMYDIKTHDADDVRDNLDQYCQQLNVYAHIWRELRGEPLDEASVIATDYPPYVRLALESGDAQQLAFALERWDPVVPIPYDVESVEATIREFGDVVDAIEDGVFGPRDVGTLREKVGTSNKLFATLICAECDARFSCGAFRLYASEGRSAGDRRFQQMFLDMGEEQEGWVTANLAAADGLAGLVDDFMG